MSWDICSTHALKTMEKNSDAIESWHSSVLEKHVDIKVDRSQLKTPALTQRSSVYLQEEIPHEAISWFISLLLSQNSKNEITTFWKNQYVNSLISSQPLLQRIDRLLFDPRSKLLLNDVIALSRSSKHGDQDSARELSLQNLGTKLTPETKSTSFFESDFLLYHCILQSHRDKSVTKQLALLVSMPWLWTNRLNKILCTVEHDHKKHQTIQSGLFRTRCFLKYLNYVEVASSRPASTERIRCVQQLRPSQLLVSVLEHVATSYTLLSWAQITRVTENSKRPKFQWKDTLSFW